LAANPTRGKFQFTLNQYTRPAQIELSEFDAELTTQRTDGVDLTAVHYKVKYRCTQGAPEPGEAYRFVAVPSEGSSHFAEKDGKDLKSQGVLEETFLCYHGVPRSFELSASRRERGGTVFQEVSNKVSRMVR
jgi:hypothetical protein